MTRKFFYPLILFCLLAAFATSCKKDPAETIAEQIWEYAQKNPEGFNLDINTMTEPAEGVAVSYENTQAFYSREALSLVVRHAREHDGYVCGWRDEESGQFIFGSDKLFPESQLEEAKAFGRANRQQNVFIISSTTVLDLNKKLISTYYYGGTDPEDLSTYTKKTFEYDALGRIVLEAADVPEIGHATHKVYSYGDGTIQWTLYSGEIAEENATDRAEYTLNENGFIQSWVQTNLIDQETARFECRYDAQNHLTRIWQTDDTKELTITWENGEMVSANNNNNNEFVYTASDTPSRGLWPGSAVPGILFIEFNLLNMGYFGPLSPSLPATVKGTTPSTVTDHQYTYEAVDGLLQSFVEIQTTHIQMGTISFDTEYTYYQKVEWRDI